MKTLKALKTEAILDKICKYENYWIHADRSLRALSEYEESQGTGED
jgi:hypothetical protein